MRQTRAILALGLFSFCLFGLGSPAIAQEKQAPLQLLQPRKSAYEFSLPDLNGKTVNLKDFRGKVVLVNFWATWCPPCREEMPSIEKISRDYHDKGLVVLAINFMEAPNTIKPFLDTHKLTFPVLLDAGPVMVFYGIFAVPATFLIDRQGKIAARSLGTRDWTDKESIRVIQKLLDEK